MQSICEVDRTDVNGIVIGGQSAENASGSWTGCGRIEGGCGLERRHSHSPGSSTWRIRLTSAITCAGRALRPRLERTRQLTSHLIRFYFHNILPRPNARACVCYLRIRRRGRHSHSDHAFNSAIHCSRSGCNSIKTLQCGCGSTWISEIARPLAVDLRSTAPLATFPLASSIIWRALTIICSIISPTTRNVAEDALCIICL